MCPPPLQGYWSLGVTDCIGKSSSAHMAYVRSVRLAACRRQMVARRPHQPASHDGNLNLLKAPECSRSVGVTESVAVISHWSAVPVWIRWPRPRESQSLWESLQKVKCDANIGNKSCFPLASHWTSHRRVSANLLQTHQPARSAHLGVQGGSTVTMDT